MKFLSYERNYGYENSPLICLINDGLIFILKNINIRIDYISSIVRPYFLFSPSYIFWIPLFHLLSCFEVSVQPSYSSKWKSAFFQNVFMSQWSGGEVWLILHLFLLEKFR